MPEPAYGEEEWLVLSLVNTHVTGTAGAVDRLADDSALTAWCAARRLPATGSPGALARFRRLRADARRLLTGLPSDATPSSELLRRVNRAASEPVRPVLTADRSVAWEPVAAGSAEAAIARDLLRLAASPDGDRVRVCAAEDCDRLFIQDHRRRIWCSSACGNRVRARRHAARHPRTATRRDQGTR